MQVCSSEMSVTIYQAARCHDILHSHRSENSKSYINFHVGASFRLKITKGLLSLLYFIWIGAGVRFLAGATAARCSHLLTLVPTRGFF
jgi:hypothetical protein